MKTPPLALCLWFAICQPVSAQTRISIGGTKTAKALPRAVPSADGTPEPGGLPPSEIASPTLGFVFDRGTAALRRIPGISGMATVGELLSIPIPLAAAYTAPQQDYAVGISALDGAVALISFSRGAVTGMSPLTLVPPAPDRIAFSPSGDSLALFYRGSRQLIAVTGIPQAPKLASSWDLTSYGGELTALAIKDGGDELLGGITQASGGVLVLFPNGGLASVLLPMNRPAAAQYLWGSRDAIVADQAAGTVSLLKRASGSFQQLPVTHPEDGLAGPDLIAVDRAGRTLLVGQSGGPSGLAVDLSTASVASFQCDCVLSALEPLNGNLIYRVTALNAGRLVTMDASGSMPRFQTIGAAEKAFDENCPVRGRRSPLSDSSAPEVTGSVSCRAPGNREEPQ